MAWRASGESAADFAARHGWRPQTLQWWTRQLGEKRQSAPKGFVEVATREQRSTAPSGHDLGAMLEVALANGRTLRVRGTPSASTIRLMLSILEG